MRRLYRLAALPLALMLLTGATLRSSHPARGLPGVGRTQVVQGFSVKLRAVTRARQAGAADYVARRGNIFVFISVEIRRAGSHGSYYADPQDFHIQLSSGDVSDSEPFGVQHELTARHIYRQPDDGVIGFEVPARDHNLRLLWQPIFDANPDAQAEWALGAGGKTVQYYQ